MHSLNDLFLQLGLPNDDNSIALFIEKHRTDSATMTAGKPAATTPAEITKASWWTPAQAEFLRQAIHEDAEWTTCVDRLNALLQKS